MTPSRVALKPFSVEQHNLFSNSIRHPERGMSTAAASMGSRRAECGIGTQKCNAQVAISVDTYLTPERGTSTGYQLHGINAMQSMVTR